MNLEQLQQNNSSSLSTLLKGYCSPINFEVMLHLIFSTLSVEASVTEHVEKETTVFIKARLTASQTSDPFLIF